MAHDQHNAMLSRTSQQRAHAQHTAFQGQTFKLRGRSGDGARCLASLSFQLGGERGPQRQPCSLRLQLLQPTQDTVAPPVSGVGPVGKLRNRVKSRKARVLADIAAAQEAGFASVQSVLWRAPQDARRLMAGAFSGVMSKTATAPIESVRMQLMAGKGGVVQIVKETWARGGPLAFFAGNIADVLRVMPSRGVEFAAFDLYKRVLGGLDMTGNQRQPNAAFTALAGGAAGVTSTIVTYPMETIRTRLAVDPNYNGITDCFRRTVAKDGIGALYQGLGASLIGVIPYAAIRLGVYDGLKRTYLKTTGKKTMPSEAAAACGVAAGLIASSATFPLEVVRRRMMSGQHYPGTFAAIRTIAQTEGWRSLYRGLLVSSVKQAPQNAVTFYSYELAKAFLHVS